MDLVVREVLQVVQEHPEVHMVQQVQQVQDFQLVQVFHEIQLVHEILEVQGDLQLVQLVQVIQEVQGDLQLVQVALVVQEVLQVNQVLHLCQGYLDVQVVHVVLFDQMARIDRMAQGVRVALVDRNKRGWECL